MDGSTKCRPRPPRRDEPVERLRFDEGRTTSTEVAGVAYLRPVPCPRCAGPREVA